MGINTERLSAGARRRLRGRNAVEEAVPHHRPISRGAALSDTPPLHFGKFVPGFDFLQSLAKGASSSMAQLPKLSNWVAPTIDVQELDKRIQELKAVQFWLEQNSRALAATIQALEVQKMTLATLEGMNFSIGDVANAFKPKTADRAGDAAPTQPRPTQPQTTPHPPPGPPRAGAPPPHGAGPRRAQPPPRPPAPPRRAGQGPKSGPRRSRTNSQRSRANIQCSRAARGGPVAMVERAPQPVPADRCRCAEGRRQRRFCGRSCANAAGQAFHDKGHPQACCRQEGGRQETCGQACPPVCGAQNPRPQHRRAPTCRLTGGWVVCRPAISPVGFAYETLSLRPRHAPPLAHGCGP